MDKQQIKKVNRWYYLPHKKWFENRKQAKDYLGGVNKFNTALKKRDIIYIQL